MVTYDVVPKPVDWSIYTMHYGTGALDMAETGPVHCLRSLTLSTLRMP